MADIVGTEEGRVFAMIALALMVVIETICLPSYLAFLCFFREGRMSKLYPQESIRVAAAGSCLLGCLCVVVYMPSCMVLLGWHATLDHHPLVCLTLSAVSVALSISCACNMLYVSSHFAVTILRPLRVEAVFTKRRGVIIYVITVTVITVATATAGILLATDNFWQKDIVCLAFPSYWPPWMLQLNTFGFLIPAMLLSCGINSYVLYTAKKQASRMIHVQPKHRTQTPLAKVGNVQTKQPTQAPLATVSNVQAKHQSQSPLATFGNVLAKQLTQAPLATVGKVQAKQPTHAPLATLGNVLAKQPTKAPLAMVVNEKVEDTIAVSNTLDCMSSDKRRTYSWKGARFMCVNVSTTVTVVIPAYTVLGLVTLCQECLPPEIAFVVFMLLFAVTILGPVVYLYNSSRARNILKADILRLCERS